MVSDSRVAVRVRTGSYRLVDEDGSVVAGAWATDRASGPAFADHGEHELEGVPGAWRLFAVKG